MLRKFLIGTLAVLALAAIGPAVSADQKIVFGLDFQTNGRHAPYFVALEKGFYKDEGLDVEIQRGYGSAEAVKRVASRAVTFGFGDASAVMLSRAAGLNVKMVAIIYGDNPGIVVTRQQVTQPAELEGLTLAAPAGSGSRALFPAFAKAAGIDSDKVKWLTVDGASVFPVVMSGQADGTVTFNVAAPKLLQTAEKAGVKLHFINYKDFGMPMYSNGLLARDETIAENPELVAKFVRATLKGLEHAIQNPEEAAEIVVRRHPELDKETAVEEILVVSELAQTPESKEHGLGHMLDEKMAKTYDIVRSTYTMDRPVDLSDVYTNEFLPRR